MISISARERVDVAAKVGLNEQYLYQCLTLRRRPPADRCPHIERALDGRVTCEQMRPDVRWQRVPDPAWPHPEGRPCIDVAAPAVPASPPGAAAQPPREQSHAA